MPTGSNMEAVRAAYQAFTANDPERFVALLEPEFVSRQSEAVRWRGTYRGPDGVIEMFGRVATRATATYEPGEVIDGGDRIVVVGRARITPKATGKPFDVRELHVWQVRQGRLMGLEVFLNAPAPLLAALDA
jgi:uncharacterized protein